MFTEQRQLAKLVGLSSMPELEEAQKEVVQLKVCTKLNKLQPSKVSTYCATSAMCGRVHKLLAKLLPNITLLSSYTAYKKGLKVTGEKVWVQG